MLTLPSPKETFRYGRRTTVPWERMRPHRRGWPVGWMDRVRRARVFNSIVIVQALTIAEATNVSTLQSSAFGSTPANGNTIIVGISIVGGGILNHVTSIIDTQGSNTWAKDIGHIQNAPRIGSEIWRCASVQGAASFKLTVNMSSSCNITFSAIEVSGLATNPTDGSSENDSGGLTNTSAPTGPFSTLQASELIVILLGAGAVSGQTITTPTSPFVFTSQAKEQGNLFANHDLATAIVSSLQTNINPTWALAQNAGWSTEAMTYKASVAPVALPGGTLPMMVGAQDIQRFVY